MHLDTEPQGRIFSDQVYAVRKVKLVHFVLVVLGLDVY